MAVYSTHNKYVSIPDWFTSLKKDASEKTAVSTAKLTVVVGGSSSGVSSGTGVSEINLYNKFVLTEVSLDKDALVNENVAIIAVKSEINNVGDLLTANGWYTTEYISIAANSLMTITASVHDNYGLVFYDNTKTVISGTVFTQSPQDVQVPKNAVYYRISSNDVESFSILYFIENAYSSELLEQSNSNIEDYLYLDASIPEGCNTVTFTNDSFNLLVQKPLLLTKDKNNIIKLSLPQSIDGVWELKTHEETLEPYIFTKYPVVTQYGVTVYADLNKLNLPDIYAGLPVDGTIVRNEDGVFGIPIDNTTIVLDNGKLTVVGGTGGDVATEVAWTNVKGKPSWLTDDKIQYTEVEGLAEKLTEYVTFDEDEQIEGVKDFLNGIKINGLSITNSQEDVIYIDSNLVVRGGITMYADNTVDVPSLMESIATDGITIINDNGILKLNPNLELGTGGISSLVINVGSESYTGTGTKDVTVTLPDFVEMSDLLNYVTKSDLENYASEKYVTIAGNEDVTGVHSFVNGLKVGSSLINQLLDDVVYIDGHLAVKGGITMYVDNGTIDLPNLYDGFPTDGTIIKNDDGSFGIPIDNSTIVLSNGKLTVVGGTGGGGTVTEIAWSDIKGKPSWLNDDEISYSEVEGLTDQLNEYIPISGYTEVTGEKNFTGGLFVNDSLIVYDKDNKYWKLDGDLLVTGAITMFANEGTYSPSTIMDAIRTDEVNLKVVNGVLTFVGETGGGVADSVDWENIDGKPSWIGSVKPSYTFSEIGSKPTTLSGYGITDAKISNGVITLGANTITPLTAHQTIYDLTFQAGAFSAKTFDPNGAAQTVNIPTKTSHITNDSNFITPSYVDGKFVTIAGNEDVTGVHNFVNGLKIGSVKVSKSQTGVLYLEGDLVVKGGITMYGTDSVTASTIMDAISVDGTTIMNDGKKLYLNPNLELGGLDEDALSSYLITNKYLKGDVSISSSKDINFTLGIGSIKKTITDLTARYTSMFSVINVSASGYDLNEHVNGGIARNYGAASYWVNAPSGMTYGEVLSLATSNGDSLSGQLAWDINHNSQTDTTKSLWWRARDTNNGFTYSKWHQIAFTDMISSTYLKLSGGTVTGNVVMNGGSATSSLIIKRSPSVIMFQNSSGTTLGYLGFSATNTPCMYTTGSVQYTLLNGNNYSSYLPLLNSSSTHATNTSVIYAPTSGGTKGYVLQANGATSVPTWIALSSLSVGYATQPYINNSSNNGTFPIIFTNTSRCGTPGYDSLYVDTASGSGYNPSTNTFYATTFSGALSGNATSASRLTTTSKTAWGQTYWTSGGVPTSISGNMTGVGSITMNGSLKGATSGDFSGYLHNNAGHYIYDNADRGNRLCMAWVNGLSCVYSIDKDGQSYNDLSLGTTGGALYYDASTGRWGVGTTSPSYKVHVNGTTGFSGHVYLTGANSSSSTGNTSQILFGTSSSHHLALSSNSRALIINPTSSSTTGQIMLGVDGNRSYFTSSGNFGIGTSNPSSKLHVVGSVTASALYFGNEYQKSISSAGWYRFATSNTANNVGGTYLFFIRRGYNHSNNEAYIISCIVDYEKVHWNLLNGHANTRLITQVRCTYTNSSTIYFDFYYNGAVSNTVYVNAVGDCTLQAPTSTSSTLTSTSTFGLGDGMIIDGNLLVKGGVTMYATSSESPITDFYTSRLVLTETENSSAFNDKGIMFGSEGNARIGINSSNDVGIYGGGRIFLRPNSLDSASSIGMCLETTGNAYLSGGLTIGATSSNSNVVNNTYKLHVTGKAYVTGTLTQGSDIRYKDIHKDILLSLATIAEAPSIEFHFKDDEQKSTHIGTSAQYWQSVSGVVTEDYEGRLGMDYSSLGVVMGISLAKELSRFESDTDRRIRLLEEENKKLKEEIEQLKTI